MGLFDKKKKGDDDYDSPVEQVNLSRQAAPAAAPSRSAAPPTGSQSTPPASSQAAPAPQPQAQQQSPLASAPAAPAPAPRARTPEPEYDVPNYGIEKAIELMRLLPADNVELVVQVVKKTLESLQIQVPSIIKDASRKQQDIEGRIDVLKKEIFELESEISTRKTEISALETDHKETTSVKERLILAEKLTEERKGGPASAASPGASTGATTTPAASAPRPSGSYPAVSAQPQSASPAGVPAPTPAPRSETLPAGSSTGPIKK